MVEKGDGGDKNNKRRVTKSPLNEFVEAQDKIDNVEVLPPDE